MSGNYRVRAIGAVMLVALLGLFVALHVYRNSGPDSAPANVSVSPKGNEVDRLTPVSVHFRNVPKEHDGASLMQVTPASKGTYAWQDDRTLVFQPDFPGFLRGQEYKVRVRSTQPSELFDAFSFQFVTAGALTVDSVIPAPDDVEVPANAQVLVQFSRSIAPLTTLAEQPTNQVVLFDPPLKGTGEWLNTSLYRFTPDPTAVAPFTKYTLRIPARLSDEPDGALKQDYVWSYMTYSPALVSVTPGANTKFAAPDQKVSLKFNQPMDHASVEAGLHLTFTGTNTALPGSYAWDDSGTSVTFTANDRLAPLGHYELVVDKGLRSTTGGQTRVEWRSVFDAIGLPSVRSTSPRDGETSAQRYGASITFTNPMNEDSFDDRIAITGIAAKDIQTTFTPDGLNVYVNARFDVSTFYTITLADGTFDRYGQPLGPYKFSFMTGSRPPSITLAVPSQIATYSSSAEPLLYFHATNSDKVTFTLYPLTPAEILTMQQSNRIDNDPRQPFVPSQKALYTWTEDASGAKDEVVLRSTSLSRNRGPLVKGDYLLRYSGSNFTPGLAFSVVDTALITKVSFDELMVWALDLDTGRPLANIAINETGSPLAPNASSSMTTNDQGLASFSLSPSNDSYSPPTRNFVVSLAGGGRKGVSSTSWQQGAYPFTIGLPIESYPRKYVANIYTERPIYKPGEEATYKAVLRLDDDAQYTIPSDAPNVFLVINDPQQKQLLHLPVQLNDFGTFAGSLNLSPDAPTGTYSVQVVWEAAANYKMPLASTSFVVAEFRTPEFQVTASTASPSYIAGEDIQAQVEATYYFGGALEGAPVTWSATSNSYSPGFKAYPRYSFSDTDPSRTAVYKAPLRSEGNAIIDARGDANFTIPAVISGNEGAQQYQIGASVSDQSAQAVAASTSVIVYPAAAIAGIRPANYVATAGKEAQIDLVTLDTNGTPVPNRGVNVQVYDRTWVTTKEATSEGARRYVSQPKDTLLTTLTTTTGADAKGSVFYTPSASGSLRLVAEIRDDKGRVARSSTYLYVSGGQYASWQITNDDTLKLIADRSEYSVGDTAEVLVPAPFQGAIGLVTVERGKVITRAVQQFPTNSERLAIPIVDRDVPDVFVSTILYRPPTNEDPVPRYKVGYVELPVSTDTRVLNVQVTPDRDQAQPGDTVHYDVKVTDFAGHGVRSEVSVAVVDKALLSLTDERGLNGLKAFWFQRGLGVVTASSLAVSINRSNDVIAEPPLGGGKGGDGVDDERIRQDFRNTAFWQAQLTTDDTGNAGFDVKMPDNLTTWHTQVRAIGGNTQVGEGTNELVSTQPLLLRPALPRFLRVGDQPTLRALVRNATKTPTDVMVTMDATGVTLGAAKDKTVRVEPNSSTLVEWPATVPQEGKAEFTITARNSAGPGTGDAVKLSIPIYQAITPETTATGGVVINQPVSESVYLPSYANTSQGSLTVSVQASLVKALGPELSAFDPPPWSESSERIASRIIATLAVKRADPATAASNTGRLPSDVASLLHFQRSDGGFAWCITYCSSDPQMTAWVLIALGDWQRAGNKVDANVLSRAKTYVNNYVNRFTDVRSPVDPNETAFMLYAEATVSSAGPYLANMRALYEQYRAGLNNSGRAYLLLGMSMSGLTKKDAEVHTLLDDVTAAVNASATGNHWEDDPAKGTRGQQTSPRVTSLMLSAIVHIDPTHPLIEETVRWLRVALTANVARTTQERAQTIRSLAEYAALTGELGASYDYGVKLDKDQLLAGHLKSDQDPVAAQLSLKALELGKSHLLSLARDFSSKGRLYYTMALRYTTPATTVEALNRGMAVSHEYSQVDNSGRPFKLGDVVRVKVTVMLPADRDYVVVDVYLPAGLEAIDPRLKTTDVKLKTQLDAERREAARPASLDYYAPWLAWYYNPWQQVDLRDDRVTLQAQRLTRGVYEFVYYARATTPGQFYVPPAHVEESYFPEVFGRSDSAEFTIAP